MATKISGFDNVAIGSIGVGRPVQRVRDAATGGAQSSSADDGDVQITGTARQLANIEQAVRDTSVINESRVAQLRTAIEQGTYSVRPEHIASQLMQMEHTLGQLPNDAQSEEQPATSRE